MAMDALTDEMINGLLDCRKALERTNVKVRVEGKHQRRDYAVRSDDGEHEFVLFTRQSTVTAATSRRVYD